MLLSPPRILNTEREMKKETLEPVIIPKRGKGMYEVISN
jgi:hypothetical protein